MPLHLKRYHGAGHDHFITFSCHNRKPYLNTPAACDLFVKTLEATRSRYGFNVFGYVVMPEHVHLVMSEPVGKPLASAMQALKLSVSKQSPQRPFWLARYYDTNVTLRDERIDILRYIHRNPVRRGLVALREDWLWSSYRHYLLHEPSVVEITSP